MLYIDLHCHSRYSDGLMAPADVVRRAAANGARALALTDHDETGGLAEARAAAAALGVAFITGVEISATWRNHNLHIVGLRFDADNPALQRGLAAIRDGRVERAKRMAAELDRLGIEGSLAGAQTHVSNPRMIGRAHFARFLVERGHAKDVKAVFKKYLAEGKPGYVAHQWASLADALGWISASGGVAVIAHPGRLNADDKTLCELFAEFKEHGGSAIEVVTGSHTPPQCGQFAEYARRFGLAASVGSDFHGPLESARDVGALPELPAGCVPVWQDWAECRAESWTQIGTEAGTPKTSSPAV
ncbi:MAG: PHP domain-containing protein [Burkholderiales bacterium]|nr:PHP domain-containing protein [Burkholderiales bacterium]